MAVYQICGGLWETCSSEQQIITYCTQPSFWKVSDISCYLSHANITMASTKCNQVTWPDLRTLT